MPIVAVGVMLFLAIRRRSGTAGHPDHRSRVVIAGIVAYVRVLTRDGLSSKIAPVCVALAFSLTVGATRVDLGHHGFTDVRAASCSAWPGSRWSSPPIECSSPSVLAEQTEPQSETSVTRSRTIETSVRKRTWTPSPPRARHSRSESWGNPHS